EVTRHARGGVFDVVGRSLPVAVSDVRGSRQWTLRVLTDTAEQAAAVDLILASGDPIFLHMPPGMPMGSGTYAVIGDTTETNLDGVVRLFTLPLTETAAPAADVVGATSTWQTVVSNYATWADVVAAHATWAELLELIGDPSEVVVP